MIHHVDITKAHKDDVAHFRCGGNAILSKCSMRSDGDYELDFRDYPSHLNIYSRYGEKRQSGLHPFDIVKITREDEDIMNIFHIRV